MMKRGDAYNVSGRRRSLHRLVMHTGGVKGKRKKEVQAGVPARGKMQGRERREKGFFNSAKEERKGERKARGMCRQPCGPRRKARDSGAVPARQTKKRGGKEGKRAAVRRGVASEEGAKRDG